MNHAFIQRYGRFECMRCGGAWSAINNVNPDCSADNLLHMLNKAKEEISELKREKAHALAVEAMETARKRIAALESELSNVTEERDKWKSAAQNMERERNKVYLERDRLILELSRVKAARNQYETKISELRLENISIGAEYQALQSTAAAVADIAERVSNRNEELETALKLASYFVSCYSDPGNYSKGLPGHLPVAPYERQHARTTLGLVNRLLGLDNAGSNPVTPTTPEN